MASLEKMLARATEKLEPGETVVTAVQGISKRIGVDTDLQKPAVLVATDRRVVLYAKDLLSKAFESYRYTDITSVMVNHGKLQGGEVTLSVAGNAVSLYRVRQGDLELFQTTVREHVDAANAATAAPQPAVSPAASATICSQCGATNPAGMNFCGGCGSPLTRSCPQCSELVTTKFCGKCGVPVDK